MLKNFTHHNKTCILYTQYWHFSDITKPQEHLFYCY